MNKCKVLKVSKPGERVLNVCLNGGIGTFLIPRNGPWVRWSTKSRMEAQIGQRSKGSRGVAYCNDLKRQAVT